MSRKKIAIHAITRNGASQAEKLARLLPEAALFISDKFCDDFPQAQPLKLPLSRHFKEMFCRYEQHICFFSIGITTRILAPLLADKRTDPGVNCIDEQARFCIPVLSGHRGGANAIASQVGQLLQATPVLTTASDTSHTLSVDLLGEPYGWQLESISEVAITPVSAAVVNGEPIIIIQEAGEQNWWPYQHPLPEHLHVTNSFNQVDLTPYQGAIIISDRGDVLEQLLQFAPHLKTRYVLWRPNSLILGVGCDRNTPLHSLRSGLDTFLAEQNLACNSVTVLASIDLKADEAGLQLLAEELQRPFITYSAATLDSVEGIENPSETVKRCVGVSSVAEAAALHHSGSNKLLVTKWKYHHDGKNMTLAACRKVYDNTTAKQATPHGTKGDCSPAVKRTHSHHSHHNTMGSKVVPGFHCKPHKADPERPLLYYRYHLMICGAGRCVEEEDTRLAHKIRNIVKEMGLNRGAHRIKINRTYCLGACRNRTTAVIYQNITPGETATDNHALWLRNIDQFDERLWRQVFSALMADENLREQLPKKHLAPVNSAPNTASNSSS